MTKKEKDLLIKDLCARLPYDVIVDYAHNAFDVHKGYYIEHSSKCILSCYLLDVFISPRQNEEGEYIKPYLFPLSSMTDKQAKEIQEIVGNPDNACIIRKTNGLKLWLDSIDTDPTIWVDTIFEVQDYLKKNHFDYRGLIEKGLAIDATGLNIY